MSSRSATRHIFLSKTMEQLKEEKKNLPMIFIDLEKAYKWYIEAVNLADVEEKSISDDIEIVQNMYGITCKSHVE